MKLQTLVETVQRRDMVPVKKNHRVRAFNFHSRVGFSPFMMVPHSGHHFRFDFSHDDFGAVGLAARFAPAVSNTGRDVLDAATLAHFVQALDVSC